MTYYNIDEYFTIRNKSVKGYDGLHIDKLKHILINDIQIEPERILLMAVYGSQNYRMDSTTSDLDCECLIFPSTDDIVFGNQLYSKQINTEYGTCTIKDVRSAFNELIKSSPNMLEIFNTPYMIINKDYCHIIEKMLNKDITLFALVNPNRLMRALNGLYKKYWDDAQNPKYLANTIRMYYLIQDIMNGENYCTLLDEARHHEVLTGIKYNISLSGNQVVDTITDFLSQIHNFENKLNTFFENATDYTPSEFIVGRIQFWEQELMMRYIKLNF